MEDTQNTLTPQPALDSLVVVGSSAGGIEALSRLVASLPANFPAPLVLAQHLDPTHPSHLHEILARNTALPVRVVATEEPLQPGVIYVVPADQHVEITDHKVRLRTQNGRRPKPSIDLLLTSAAAVFGERLIAVILTGTGSDGASGAHAVKAAGGTVVIENPATAAYPAMPASLAPMIVDIVADLERVGPLLNQLLTGVPLLTVNGAGTPLQAILDGVRLNSGIDFTRYKQPTIERRLHRRLVATGQPDLHHYLSYLQSHPEEYSRLVGAFLVKVTAFFRDPELFAALRNQVLPDLIAQARQHNNELRIWSAGCATGEEAYSLAILVAEALGDELAQFTVQIFATDLDPDAVAFARRGLYPAASVADLPAEVLERYFSKANETYAVTKFLRGLVTFGQHDLGRRPPFPRIDLVLCRNVLIYFTPELQWRALQLFAFALHDGGYLALGKAETIKPLDAYFTQAHKRLKLYRRQGDRILPPIGQVKELLGSVTAAPTSKGTHYFMAPAQAARHAGPAPALPNPGDTQRAPSSNERLGNLMLNLSAGVVVVDLNYDIQFINRAALRFLGIYKPALGNDLIHLTTAISSTALRAVIDEATRVPTPRSGGNKIVAPIESRLSERHQLQIACYPVIMAEEAGDVLPQGVHAAAVLILVTDATRTVEADRETKRRRQERKLLASHEESDLTLAYQAKREESESLREKVEQLSAVNRDLLAANEELAESNLELRSANEELVVSHEEAEAAAEEVKTLNEELQASNEELVTLNEEMEATVEELNAANQDLDTQRSTSKKS